jgi:voltage-gated potassium channel Kch
METFAEEDLGSAEIYVKSLYWTIQTITTVGYGDISGTNTIEKLFSSLIMIVGVVSFSFANGSLASIL